MFTEDGTEPRVDTEPRVNEDGTEPRVNEDGTEPSVNEDGTEPRVNLFVYVEVLRPSQQLRSCRAGQLPINTVPGQA